MNELLPAIAASMYQDMARLQSISHNLANVSTGGFKREILIGSNFAQVMDGVSNASLNRIAIPRRVLDMTQGALRVTSNPLDLAIEGEGFFELETPNGPRYTRSGSFRLDATGQLVNEAGFSLRGLSGRVLLNSATPVIDKQGNIFEKDEWAGALRTVSFLDTQGLVYEGNGLFRSDEQPLESNLAEVRIRQGHLEASNVNSPQEMVRLIEVTRHFESMQKIVQGMDDLTGKTLSTLGQF